MARDQPDLRLVRCKLTLRYGLISSLVLLVFGGVVYLQVSKAREQLLRIQVQQLASAAAAQMPLIIHEEQEYEQPSPESRQSMAERLGTPESQPTSLEAKRILWLDTNLRVVSAYGRFQPAVQQLLPSANRESKQFLALGNGLGYWRPVILRREGSSARQLDGYVLVALSTSGSDQELTRLRNGLLIGGGLAVLVAGLLSQWMVATSLKPIRTQMERLTSFSRDASHELRHPLTAIRAVIAGILERQRASADDPELRGRLQLIDQASAQMARLIDDLLLLTRLDRSIPERHHWRRFDLADLCDDLLNLFADRASAQQLRFQADLQRPAWVEGNPDQLRQLISNLLANALQFSPSGTQIALSLQKQRDQLELVVEDQGPGIPLEQRRLVFERFWQADHSRSGPHSGLGLAIARSITETHGGRIEAQQGSQGGCRMVVSLRAAG